MMGRAARPAMLVILDGWGCRDEARDNAVRQARTPHFDRLWTSMPHAFLRTDGEAVGLPEGQFGNSEVGHLNIGAGRTVMQELPRINRSIRQGLIADLPPMRALIAALRANGGACHLIGLVSPGGVHAHQDHGIALARILDAAGIRVVVHAWTDGRDTPPRAGRAYLRDFAAQLPESVRIGSVCGRYYALDRDNRWDRVAQAYAAIARGEGARFDEADAVMAHAAAADITDEFVPAAVIGDYAGLRPGDAILSFNYRADRIREILSALIDPDFTEFARPGWSAPNAVVGMTHYSDALARHMGVLFPPQSLHNILGAVVSAAGRTQLRMAETEKYPHVTYFLNGGQEAPFPGEDRTLVPSPKVATYDLQPEMSAPELTDRAVAAIRAGRHDMMVLNFANPDMVGHTGDLQATIRAVETVDTGLGRIADAVLAAGGVLLIAADHGNCETMRDPDTGEPHTAHTLNKVPVILAGDEPGIALHDGVLADLAPTLLGLMGLPQPDEMTGRSLIDRVGRAVS